MDAVYAEELLRERGHDLTPQGLYDCILATTGNKGKAESARARRMLDEMPKG